MNQIVRCK